MNDPISVNEPEPTEPEPTAAEPTEQESTESEPAESEPAEPEPAEPEPAEPEPAESEPTEPEPAEPEPAEPEPAEPEPAEPEPAEPEPTEPEPTEPEPAVSAPLGMSFGSGQIPVSALATTGPADASTVLHGDGSWSAVTGGSGAGTIYNVTIAPNIGSGPPVRAADVPGLAAIATTGAYSDLTGTPVIPPELPAHSDHQGWLLSTDGTNAAWVPNPGAATGADPDSPPAPPTVQGDFATAFGSSAHATGYGTSAFGLEAHAAGRLDTAIGGATSAHSGALGGAVAVGAGANAQSTSIALGMNAHATELGAAAAGANASATGVGAFAIGFGANASGIEAQAFGATAAATHNNAVALGGIPGSNFDATDWTYDPADPDLPFTPTAAAATTTRDNQIMLGSAPTEVNIPGHLVMKSPNGTEYKITVDDAGNLTTTRL